MTLNLNELHQMADRRKGCDNGFGKKLKAPVYRLKPTLVPDTYRVYYYGNNPEEQLPAYDLAAYGYREVPNQTNGVVERGKFSIWSHQLRNKEGHVITLIERWAQ